MRGKIVKGIAGFYYVYAENDILYECKARGVLRTRKITPLVGDDVDITITDEESREGSIENVLPRLNSLIRPAVANVDQALIFFARNNPEPNMGLLDRLLITMERQDIDSVIAFNKSDLEYSDSFDLVGEKQAFKDAGYTVIDVCVNTGDGIELLKSKLKGKTTTLAGPSGAGKSSLINMLCPDADMETGDISAKLGRGRHTTRHAEIFVMEHDSYIVDTPGFTSYDIDSVTAEELSAYYPEFSPFVEECKFSTCSHIHEPKCGVREAVERGEISKLRYDRYVRTYNELKGIRRY